MSLTDALSALSQAHGSKALATAFAVVQGQVRKARGASKEAYGPLAQTFVAAMKIGDQQKADGVSRADRLAGLEKTLRAAWPQTREWKYLCSCCADYGYEVGSCPGLRDAMCRRTREHAPHEFVTPCWCSAGTKYREKPKPSAEDFTQAGRSKPSKSMTRMGR